MAYMPIQGRQDQSGNILHVDEPQPGTSKQKPRNPKISKQGSNKGGGGAASSHGLNFHLNTATLLLFRLREIHQKDPNFEFYIWLEKAGYEKLDDIVVRYKKSGGKWTEICVQCKHATEKIDENGTKYVSNLTAEDFLTESKNRKDFSLEEYFKSFKIIEDKNDEIERFYVLHSNRPFKKSKFESKYAYFDLLEYSEQTGDPILDDFFPCKSKIKYTSELIKKLHSSSGDVSEDDRDKKVQFFQKFFYVCDDRDLEKEIHEKVAKHCKNNEEQMKILEARLHHLFWEMYQHKRDPDQTFLLNEFFRSIQFNVQRAHAHFAGRVEHIKKIKDALESERKKHMLDLLVTGMAGMGKTQMVLKYIEQNKQNHKNIIWINAESKESLEYSFEGIAKHCQLENDTNKIYSYLRDDTLFVFDNADKVMLAKNDKNEYIYLPNNAQCIDRNKFIILSQDKKWTTSFIVNVDTFSEKDALEYLDITIECSKKDKLKLAAKYQYWPLALCLAVSYIMSQPDVQLGLKSYSDVISRLQTDNTKLHEHLPGIHEMEAYNISLKLLWQRFQKTLDSKEKLALKIVEIMSLSDPDNFPIALLKFEDSSAEDVNRAVLFLCNYSIVSISEVTISIHRTLQSVIRKYINSYTNHFEHTLILGTECFTKYLKSMNDFERMTFAGNIHIATFLIILLESEVSIKEYINLAKMLLKKLKQNGDIGRDCKTNIIYDSMITKIEQKIKDIQLGTPDLLFEKALILSKIRKYEESLNLINVVIEIYTKELGENHLKTLNSMHRKAIVLDKMENYDEALKTLNQVIELKKSELGNSHTETLKSIQRKADVLMKVENYAEALKLYEQIVELEGVEICNSHPHILKCVNNKATLLFLMDDYEEALRTSVLVSESAKGNMCNNFRNYITSKNYEALLLMLLGKYGEAFNIFEQSIEEVIEKIPDNHLLIVELVLDQTNVLMRIGKCTEVINICDQINDALKENLGDNHPIIRETLDRKAQNLEFLGMIETCIKIVKHLPYPKLRVPCQNFLETHHDSLISITYKVMDLRGRGKEFKGCVTLLCFLKDILMYNITLGNTFRTLGIIVFHYSLLFLCLDIFELESFLDVFTVYITLLTYV